MDPRFDRAHGAMVGLFYGQALEVDTAVDKGSESATLSESVLALMAACLALGIPAKRGILLANCAATLATPTSLPTRDSLEAAAAELLARDQF